MCKTEAQVEEGGQVAAAVPGTSAQVESTEEEEEVIAATPTPKKEPSELSESETFEGFMKRANNPKVVALLKHLLEQRLDFQGLCDPHNTGHIMTTELCSKLQNVAICIACITAHLEEGGFDDEELVTMYKLMESMEESMKAILISVS